MASSDRAIGRMKAALVFGQGDAARAVITTLTARLRPSAGDRRVIFSGPAVFEPDVAEHLSEVVPAVVDTVTDLLLPGSERRTFEVSVVNIGAASAQGIGLWISGRSAGAPLLLALLSAGMQILLPQDVVVTGDVASPDGDIRPVKGIPAKLAAAIAHPGVRHFVCPSPDVDSSLAILAPLERERIADAIIAAKGRIRISEVPDVFELVRALVDDESAVLAALRNGYHGRPTADGLPLLQGGPASRTAALLMQDNEARFWRVLGSHLLDACNAEAKRLLLERARYHVQRREYPHGFGLRVLQLLRSLPQAIKRLKLQFPLLSPGLCLELWRFAPEEAHQDVQYLMEAVIGKATQEPGGAATEVGPPAAGTGAQAAGLDALMGELSAEALARTIGLPIDSARAAYVIESPTVDSNEAFLDAIAAFYLFLLCRTQSIPTSVDSQAVAKDAVRLVESGFANRGGWETAAAEARYPVHGGMRLVLDLMTEQYKAEQQATHVRRLIKEAVDPLDWDARVACTAAILKRLAPHLSPEIRDQPAERFAQHFEQIVEIYGRSLDRVRELFRSL